MIHLYPLARATLQASNYFTTDLAGFLDSKSRFKVFDYDEAPSAETPFIHIEQEKAGQQMNTSWADTYLTFHVMGKDTQKALLWEIADQIRSIFQENELFTSVGGDAPVQFQTIGDATFETGRNPVTGHCVVSVALKFGIVD